MCEMEKASRTRVKATRVSHHAQRKKNPIMIDFSDVYHSVIFYHL